GSEPIVFASADVFEDLQSDLDYCEASLPPESVIGPGGDGGPAEEPDRAGERGIRGDVCPPMECRTPAELPAQILPGESTEGEVDVPPGTGSVTVSRFIPGSDVALSLVSPTGRVIDRTTTDPDVTHELTPTHEYYTIADPEPGAWTVRLFGADVPSQGEPVAVIVRLTPGNHPPTAVPRVSEEFPDCEDGVGARVTLDATASSDPDGDALSYAWEDNAGTILGSEVQLEVTLPVGTHTVTLTVDDGRGGTDSGSAMVSVGDATPPVIQLEGPSTVRLRCGIDAWVEPGATAFDACAGDVAVAIGGDVVDPAICGDYTLTYDASDPVGNAAETMQRTVQVVETPICDRVVWDLAAVEEEAGVRLTWSDVGADSYTLFRREDGSELLLSVVMPPETTFLDANVLPGRTYGYAIRSICNGGESELSNIATVTLELPDADQDGVADPSDNCIQVANPDQRDTDADGFGSACDPDYNNDGAVGIPDFSYFRERFGRTIDDPGFDPLLDHNGDGAIGIPDFNVLRQLFGGPPGPSGLDCAGTIPCPTP
ncbi:MAG: DUF5011 domain-containing protein, partial [Myxococcota bacterium]|nr:DUF5011 domain-containing protein [Myxococcota bacterium]